MNAFLSMQEITYPCPASRSARVVIDLDEVLVTALAALKAALLVKAAIDAMVQFCCRSSFRADDESAQFLPFSEAKKKERRGRKVTKVRDIFNLHSSTHSIQTRKKQPCIDLCCDRGKNKQHSEAICFNDESYYSTHIMLD